MWGQQVKAAKIFWLLFLFITQTGCIYVAYLSGKMNQATDSVTKTNSGLLVAAPGTRLEDLRRNSTLDIGEGVKSMVETSKRRTFQQSKRFDWQLPDSKLLFKDCNSYSIYTDEAGETVVDMQIGTAERYYTWAEVKKQMLDIEQRLLNDGWQQNYWQGRSSSERLHEKLENPTFESEYLNDVAGAYFTKGDMSFSFYAKYFRQEKGKSVEEGQNFLHYVLVKDTAYEAKKRRESEEESQRINEMLRRKEAK